MKTLICVAVLALLCISAYAKVDTVDAFHFWAKTHGKTYGSNAELHRRLSIFSDNLKLINKHNSESHGFYLAVNQFADLTVAEFRAQYLGTRFNATAKNAMPFKRVHRRFPAGIQVPSTMDWRTSGAVTHIKNQGQCGSCWSFSTTGSVEGAHKIATGSLVSLSEQQLVDCSGSFGNDGCNGGLMDDAFQYIISVGGLETESQYPYTAQDGSCQANKALFKVDIRGFQDIAQYSESDLLTAVGSVGPVSVAIDASHSSFQFYSSGVYYEPQCSESQLDHGVLAIGYGSYSGSDYWLVKNSWGTSWGLSGYIMMSRNRNNNCGIATAASYPTGAFTPSEKFDAYVRRFQQLGGKMEPFNPLA